MSAINTSTDNIHSVNPQITTGFARDLPDKNSAISLQPAIEVKAKEIVTQTDVKTSDSEQQKALITPEQLQKVAQKLQDFVNEMNKGLEFSVDKDSGRDVIKVIDKKSGDLIKQYPTEEVLDLVAKLSEATGNFINTDV